MPDRIGVETQAATWAATKRVRPLARTTLALCMSLAAGGLCATALGETAAEAEAPGLDTATLNQRLEEKGIDLTAEDVQPAGIPGMYEVELSDDQYLYVTEDVRYMLLGNLYELTGENVVAVTEGRRRTKRLRLVAEEAAEEALAFPPEDDIKASVLVFTDTDCGYCRRMHTAMDEYHALGIEVRYLAYPRAGVGSPTYESMVSAWCADDPNDALTALKRGEDIPPKSCVNPVAEQYELGRKVGITGTPSILLPDGDLLPGLVDAEQLASRLGI